MGLACGAGAPVAEAAQVGKPAAAEAREVRTDGKAGRVEAGEPKVDGKPDKPAAVRAPRAEAKPDGKVNINVASRTQLMTLDGVGPTAAKRIIDHREANGPFKKAEDLAKVDGIGRTVVEKNAGRITVR
jgi:competence protein ComEA